MKPIRLSAAGHPAVTGRHDKTLELTAADSITARAAMSLLMAYRSRNSRFSSSSARICRSRSAADVPAGDLRFGIGVSPG